MKIAVVGGREFKYAKLVMDIVAWEFNPSTNHIFISGGARGVDTIAEDMIKYLNQEIRPTHLIKKIIFKADWENLKHPDAIIKTRADGTRYDAKAGYRRNKLIVNEADKIIAFWDGKSTGTKQSIDLAIKAGKPVDIYIRR